MSRRPARCTKADIRRALEAAQAAGVDVAVEILPDGTIRLVQRENAPKQDLGLPKGLVM